MCWDVTSRRRKEVAWSCKKGMDSVDAESGRRNGEPAVKRLKLIFLNVKHYYMTYNLGCIHKAELTLNCTRNWAWISSCKGVTYRPAQPMVYQAVEKMTTTTLNDLKLPRFESKPGDCFVTFAEEWDRKVVAKGMSNAQKCTTLLAYLEAYQNYYF